MTSVANDRSKYHALRGPGIGSSTPVGSDGEAVCRTLTGTSANRQEPERTRIFLPARVRCVEFG